MCWTLFEVARKNFVLSAALLSAVTLVAVAPVATAAHAEPSDAYEVDSEGSMLGEDELEPFQEDAVVDESAGCGCNDHCENGCQDCCQSGNNGVYGNYSDCWDWQLLPDGLIYRSYLAGPKESRFGSVWFNDDRIGNTWDVALGGRVGILRYGSMRNNWPEGWQVDIEGAAFPRLDMEEGRRELVSADFRFGIPITYGVGPWQTKLAYYHISSHLGDEFMIRNPMFERINYTRDAGVWGNSYYLTDDVRLYGEVAYAFGTDGGAEPWEFQFGTEYSPSLPTGFHGTPFAAMDAHLREEVDFGGTFTVQAGWQWRGFNSGSLLRIGGHYLVGKSPQYSFFDRNEEQIGLGIWYDY